MHMLFCFLLLACWWVHHVHSDLPQKQYFINLEFYMSSDRAIPSSNLDLHFAHCSRNLERCKTCGDMVPKKHAEEHFLTTHAPVSDLHPFLYTCIFVPRNSQLLKTIYFWSCIFQSAHYCFYLTYSYCACTNPLSWINFFFLVSSLR